MKHFRILILFAILLTTFRIDSTIAQEPDSLNLNIVWQKEVFPKNILDAKFSIDGQWIYAVTGGNIEKLSALNGEFITTFDKVDTAFIYKLTSMNISASGNYIVNTNGNGAVIVWDTRIEKKIKQIQIGASAVSITADDKYLLIASQRPESRGIIVYNLQTDQQEKLLKINYSITSTQVSHNGQYFATGGWYEVTDFGENYGKKFDQVILWDAQTFTPVDTVETIEGEGSGYNIIKFSKDDKYLGCIRLAPWDGRIYDINSQLIIAQSEPSKKCGNIEFYPNNDYYLLYYADFGGFHELSMYNLATSIKIHSFSYYAGVIDLYNSTTNFKIFCTSKGGAPITLLTNQIVGVEEGKIKTTDIKITQVNNMIVLETSNLNQTEINVEIYNLKGDIVHSELIENKSPDSSYKIDTLLPSGFYLCKVIGGSLVFSQKIEIVR